MIKMAMSPPLLINSSLSRFSVVALVDFDWRALSIGYTMYVKAPRWARIHEDPVDR